MTQSLFIILLCSSVWSLSIARRSDTFLTNYSDIIALVTLTDYTGRCTVIGSDSASRYHSSTVTYPVTLRTLVKPLFAPNLKLGSEINLIQNYPAGNGCERNQQDSLYVAYIDYGTDSTWNVLHLSAIKTGSSTTQRIVTEIESRYFNSDTLTFRGFIKPINTSSTELSQAVLRINVFKTKTLPKSWPGGIKKNRVSNLSIYMQRDSQSFTYLKDSTKGMYYTITGQWIDGFYFVYGVGHGVE